MHIPSGGTDLRGKIGKRVNRISGQIGGIQKMVADDRYFVAIQISAVRSALDALGVELLSNHVECCVLGSGTSSELARAKPMKPHDCSMNSKPRSRVSCDERNDHALRINNARPGLRYGRCPCRSRSAGYHGATYHFCSAGCAAKFNAEPARYVAEAVSRDHSMITVEALPVTKTAGASFIGGR